MIPVLLAVLMQAGGAYTHLPKLALFPNPGVMSLTTAGPPPKVAMAERPCSVHMPRMAIPKDVNFQIGTVAPAATEMPAISAPAPECPAPKPGK